ncbi:MAG: MTH1187 family thiamine-binding protein [Acidobacteriota bacterium]|nr:MTH1187 family thiamine-binding protein [Acidobacteriota bacterium]MDQ7088470.1 MTH1187 family thiamine-binding protein [Acidobacteriota bacterium]
MKVLAEIQVIPIGVGVSVREPVRRAHQLLVESGLEVQLHAYGTNVEGELDEVLDAIRRIHEILHAEGVPRLSTAVKIGSRTDKEVSLAGKLFS